MGGLFSTPDSRSYVTDYYRPPPPTRRATTNIYSSREQTENASLWTSYSRPSNSSVPNQNANLSRTNTYRSSINSNLQHPTLYSPKLPTPRVAKPNGTLFNNLIQNEMHNLNWQQSNIKTTTLVTLSPHSAEYSNVHSNFYRYIGNKKRKNFQVTRIVRIQNPYLLAAFEIKKAELQKKFGRVTVMELFHGTKTANMSSIRTENFNWRLHGTSLGHRFGRGVSFSPKSFYSTHYCDKNNSVEKVMILARVLAARSCVGTQTTLLPPAGCDTTQKPNGDVIVKYEDNEFYPAYEIYFKEVNYVISKVYNDYYDYDYDDY